MSVLEIRDVVVRFSAGGHAVDAVDHVGLSVGDRAVVGLVGESGSGKSTLARAVVGLVPLAAGEILLDGEPIRSAARRSRRPAWPGRQGRQVQQGRQEQPWRRARQGRLEGDRGRLVQMVFQDPYASLNPRMSIGESICEGIAAGRRADRGARRPDVRELLELVRLDPDQGRVRPGQLSGGQRQRVALARALAARPKVLIADEITSALDVSVQGAVLNLLREVQRETGVGVLFISHNLAVVRYLSDSIAVMSGGRVVEAGPTEQVTRRPREAYTRSLIAAVPSLGGGGSGGSGGSGGIGPDDGGFAGRLSR